MSFIKKLAKLNPAPIVPLPYSRMDVTAEVIALLSLLLSFLTLYLNWSSLPAIIPIHFNFAGETVRMGSKSELLELQFIIAMIYLLITVVSRFPRWYRYPWKITAENASRQYSIARSFFLWLKVLCMGAMSLCTWRIIQVALCRTEGLGTIFGPTVLMLLFALIAAYLLKAIRAIKN
ncbi:MAG: DUF1648 domain-containing protein [Sedimentisphaerales bacterium]|nr:DUF1648 domain-containing protein [Sedimentisphaerales bacterium]